MDKKRRDKYNELGERALILIQEHMQLFTGLVDSITHEEGYICFQIGDRPYKMWHYAILNNPIDQVQKAVQWRKQYYDKKKRDE